MQENCKIKQNSCVKSNKKKKVKQNIYRRMKETPKHNK